MSKRLLIIIACLIYINSLSIQAEELSFVAHKFTVADGLPSNNIRELVQDGDGYIWLGTTGGLCRFDGYQFVTFNTFNNPSEGNNTLHVGQVKYSDKGSSIWISTSSLLTACYQTKTGQFVDYTGFGGQYNLYSKRLETKNAILLYDTTNGIRRITYDNGKYSATDYNKSNGLPNNHVIKALESSRGYTWAITERGFSIIDPRGIAKIRDNKTIFKSAETWGDYVMLIAGNEVLKYNATGSNMTRHTLPAPMGSFNTVTSTIAINGKLFIFTQENVIIFDIRTSTFSISQECDVKGGKIQKTTANYTLVANKGTTLWIIDNEANIQKLNIVNEIHVGTEKSRIYTAAEDKDGLLYIATYGNGLFIYNPKTQEILEHFTTQKDGFFNNDYLQDILIDREGNIWVSSETAGLSCMSRDDSAESYYRMLTHGDIGEWSNNIRSVTYAEKENNIWLSTKDNKLYNYDLTTGEISLVKVLNAPVFTTLRDCKGQMWIGTRGTGLYVDGEQYTENDSINLISNDIYKILEDKNERIWLATWQGGLHMTSNKAGELPYFTNFLISSYNEKRQHDLCFGDNGDLWIATNNGLYVVNTNKKSITNKDFTNYNTQNGSLPTNEIVCLYFDHESHTLWAGTTGCGVIQIQIDSNRKIKSIKTIDRSAGLANNIVKAIIKDKNGLIWVSTEEDLSRIEPKTGSVRTIHIGQSLQSNIFAENAALLTADGRMIFGTGYGLAIVRPKPERSLSLKNVNVCITELRINGTSVYNSPDMDDKQRAYASEGAIELTHKQNSITLFFSNFLFSQAGTSTYQYMLEGYDDDWRTATSVNYAEYTNVSPGEYIFKVRTMVDNKWIEGKPFTIKINQPLYNTWWAWLLYLIITAVGGWYLYKLLKKNFKLQHEISLNKELSEFRLNFFTHVTHEFRTPLAIISNSMDTLTQANTPQTTQKAAIKSAKRGTNRMLRLVNELMEFRKLSVGGSRLAVEKGDIIGFVRNIYQDLWTITKRKEIDMTFTPFAKEYQLTFDHAKIETIVFNIVSNAVKYTPQKGQIAIKLLLNEQEENIAIVVEDSGKGISKEQEKELFHPFMHGLVSQGGMGIGLYSAKEMVKLHHGDISYQKSAELGGAQFTITIPSNEDIYTADDYIQDLAIHTESDGDNSVVEEVILNMHTESLNDLNLAIIEDDTDMLEQISSVMSQYFHVTTYMNGEDAINGIMETKPDVIISDVMLPDTNGYDIVKKLRSETAFINTPIIMLTALDDERHQMKGYEAGADDYVTKPCNFRVLLARIVQLYTWAHKREQQAIASATEAANNAAMPMVDAQDNNATENSDMVAPANATASTTPKQITISPLDKKFKETLEYVVAQHISDHDFTVDRLAALMQMGHTKFYGRMKDVMGVSPNKYLMNEKMRIAAELILEGKYSIAEVSFKVGFMDQSYFNKCFKQYFGCVPSKYGK
ncbi:MAG: two-component regulator propeller domain-containing protein, partial [Prevotellaceae bacterium]|nr:two-component regulator propeller domain-containing protein [Prevotellaceae bacterium]